jgi:hypothetical protein
MANLGQVFDPSQHEPDTLFEVLPPGDYTVEIINSELRDTKAGTGQYLWIDMQITDGPSKGRHIYDRLNLYNANKQASDIAWKKLTTISYAVGVGGTFSDDVVLHFKPFVAVVWVKEAGKDKQGVERNAQNEVRTYKAPNNKGSSLPSAASPAGGMTTAGTQNVNVGSASSTPPWRRNA